MTTLSYICPDCASPDAVANEDAFTITHEGTCPALSVSRLAWIAEQDVLDAALLVDACRGMVADYGSAPVHHVGRSC